MATPFPLKMGADQDFAALRDFLAGAKYTDRSLCERFGVDQLYVLIGGFNERGARLKKGMQQQDLTALLVRLFMAGIPVPLKDLRAQVPEPIERIMTSLGLLAPLPSTPDSVYSTVILYPAGTVCLASDRYVGPDAQSFYDEEDITMLGMSKVSQDFLDMISSRPCRRFLDLGTGAGNAALNAARYAERVWATDITERAVLFAEWNRRLNGLDNVEVVKGDLFQPVAGIAFDRIATNPPFEPPVKRQYIYSVGGSDGEEILRHIVEGLPTYLEPGGRMYCICLGTDRVSSTFEERIRSWLGPQSDEFDLALIAREVLEPMYYAMEATVAEQGTFDKMAAWADFFTNLGARQVVYGHVIMQRRASERPVFTLRRRTVPGTRAEHVDWLLDWETRAAEPDSPQLLMSARPRPRSDADLRVRHSFREGQLVPVEYMLVANGPFYIEMHCPAWMAMLFSRCDGSRSGGEIFAQMRDAGAAPENSEPTVVKALAALVSGGFIEIAGFEPPAV
jgi:methylase of polypeptide subunit release factors